MPLYPYYCANCGQHFETLVRSSEEEPTECPHCHSGPVTREISAHGGYTIRGDNGGSTKGKYNGSFRRTKK